MSKEKIPETKKEENKDKRIIPKMKKTQEEKVKEEMIKNMCSKEKALQQWENNQIIQESWNPWTYSRNSLLSFFLLITSSFYWHFSSSLSASVYPREIKEIKDRKTEEYRRYIYKRKSTL